MFKAFKSVVDVAAAAAGGDAAGDSSAPGNELQPRPQQPPLDGPTCYAMELLLLLLGLYWMQNDMGDFLEDGASTKPGAVLSGVFLANSAAINRSCW